MILLLVVPILARVGITDGTDGSDTPVEILQESVNTPVPEMIVKLAEEAPAATDAPDSQYSSYIEETCRNFMCPPGYDQEGFVDKDAICVANPWTIGKSSDNSGSKCTVEQCCRNTDIAQMDMVCAQNYDDIDGKATCLPMDNSVATCEANCYRSVKAMMFVKKAFGTNSSVMADETNREDEGTIMWVAGYLCGMVCDPKTSRPDFQQSCGAFNAYNRSIYRMHECDCFGNGSCDYENREYCSATTLTCEKHPENVGCESCAKTCAEQAGCKDGESCPYMTYCKWDCHRVGHCSDDPCRKGTTHVRGVDTRCICGTKKVGPDEFCNLDTHTIEKVVQPCEDEDACLDQCAVRNHHAQVGVLFGKKLLNDKAWHRYECGANAALTIKQKCYDGEKCLPFCRGWRNKDCRCGGHDCRTKVRNSRLQI